jgi:hypothetical protein
MVGQTLPALPKISQVRDGRHSSSDSESAEGNDERNSADGDVGDQNDTLEPTPKPWKKGAGMGWTALMPFPFQGGITLQVSQRYQRPPQRLVLSVIHLLPEAGTG